MRALGITFIVWVVAVLPLGNSARAESLRDPAVERLERLVAQNPGDPDLHWALARLFEERGHTKEAAEELSHFIRRWPNHRAEAYFALGRILYDAGQFEEALDYIEQGLIRSPVDAPARLYRGLCLLELGRHEEAERELEIAGHLDPELTSETLFLRALSRMQSGKNQEAEKMLQEIIERDPSSQTSRRAEMLLGKPSQAAPPSHAASKPWTLSAYGGVERDTNVTLESGASLTSSTIDKKDTRRVFGAGVSYHAYQGERSKLTIGYNYSQSGYKDLAFYDSQYHVLYGSASYTASDRSLLRLDAITSRTRLDSDGYAGSFSLRPNVFIKMGPKAGVSRIYLDAERTAYKDSPLFPSLERGGTTYSLGLEHYVSLPGWKGAWGSIGSESSRTNTSGSRDFLGFAEAFENVRTKAALNLHLPLRWKIAADLGLSVAWERYLHRNLVDALNSTEPPTRRQDRITQSSIALVRPISPNVDVELRWLGHYQFSNVGVYKYNRHIVGLYFRAKTQ